MAFPGDYEWKVDITTDSTQVDSNETSFPYYFDLSNITSADFWSNVQSDGGDLRVSSDESGSTQLPLEVVSIDTVGETGEIHFKDSTDSASDKTYYLWWSDSTGSVSQPAVSDTYGRNNVWTEYESVFHFTGDPSGTAPQLTDSTGNHDGTTGGSMTSGDEVAGQVGEAWDFDGSDDYVTLGTGWTTNNTGTISAWINKNTSASFHTIYSFGDTTNNNNVLAFQVENNDELSVNSTISGNVDRVDATPAITENAWLYVSVSSDGSQFKFRNSGSALSKTVVVGSDSGDWFADQVSADTGVIGALRRAALASFFPGTIDELRVALAELSTGWQDTEYSMQDTNATFWTVGTPEEVAGANNALFYGGGL